MLCLGSLFHSQHPVQNLNLLTELSSKNVCLPPTEELKSNVQSYEMPKIRLLPLAFSEITFLNITWQAKAQIVESR